LPDRQPNGRKDSRRPELLPIFRLPIFRPSAFWSSTFWLPTFRSPARDGLFEIACVNLRPYESEWVDAAGPIRVVASGRSVEPADLLNPA